MKVIVNESIRAKYHEGFKRMDDDKQPVPISEIVIHGTGGGAGVDSLIKWMMNGERASEYGRGIGLFHYVIDYDGKIYEIINPDKWVFHSSSGIHDRCTIGIEHMNPDKKNGRPYTKEQYDASIDLIQFLMKENDIKTIVGHTQNTLKYSGPQYVKVPCPGNFDWSKLTDNLKALGFTYTFKDERISNIEIQ